MSENVHNMFAGIARKYDLANDVLSFGVHRRWRTAALSLVPNRQIGRALDLCTGTGDLAFGIARLFSPTPQVVGLDFVNEMLRLAAAKRDDRCGVENTTVEFIRGDAMALPFNDKLFDLITIGFGIRNVDDPVSCLREIARVLAPGGTLLVLEFGKPRLPIFATLYRLYSKFIMPWLGGQITGDRAAYRYLPETAQRFPDGLRFIELLRQANYNCLTVQPFMSGIAYAYVAKQINSENTILTHGALAS